MKMWECAWWSVECPTVLWMKIWSVQLKRSLDRTDDSPLRHFRCISSNFMVTSSGNCLINLSFGNCVQTGCWRCLRKNTNWNCRPVRWTLTLQRGRRKRLEPRSHRGWDMGVTRKPWIEAAVNGVEACIIAKKDEIQADHFNSEHHAHNVLGLKRRSACGLLASRLHNQHRCLLRHTAKIVTCDAE
jgi:hypothetical protein